MRSCEGLDNEGPPGADSTIQEWIYKMLAIRAALGPRRQILLRAERRVFSLLCPGFSSGRIQNGTLGTSVTDPSEAPLNSCASSRQWGHKARGKQRGGQGGQHSDSTYHPCLGSPCSETQEITSRHCEDDPFLVVSFLP